MERRREPAPRLEAAAWCSATFCIWARSARPRAAAWRKSIEVFDEDAGHPRTRAVFPEDRATAVTPDSSIVQLRLSDMRLRGPR
jgi:hypothetical protein